MQRFLSQPMFVSEVFNAIPGVYVPREETVRGFAKIISGALDEVPEQNFYMKGTIDDVEKTS
jgi:F-type H+-transporting ATPase subunit beta